jgi:hypothetical protein
MICIASLNLHKLSVCAILTAAVKHTTRQLHNENLLQNRFSLSLCRCVRWRRESKKRQTSLLLQKRLSEISAAQMNEQLGVLYRGDAELYLHYV